MTSADDLKQAIIDEHARYRATIADLDATTLEHEPALGNWPVRDLTAHLTGWIDTLLATAAYGLGGPAPTHTTITDFDAFNAANVEAARGKDWAAVIAALDAAVERAATCVAALTDEQLATELDFPWGQRGAVSRLLAIIPHHHHEHREDVERWLAARDSAGRVTTGAVSLRDVVSDDISIFFEHRLDPEASQMAGFPTRTWDAHATQWARILDDPTTVNRTILVDGQVAGNIVSFVMDGERDVGYWLGRSFWGHGIATEALRQFLAVEQRRPLYAHAVIHNVASRRVLEKCGFTFVSENDEEARYELRDA